MLLVQKYLLTHSFSDLEKDHAVEISVDQRTGHKFSLNYNQITATSSDPLSQECRGLILSNGSSLFETAEKINEKYDFSKIIPGSTQILAHPMNRFFNYGDGACAPINWNDSSLRAYEKADGTLCIVYFDQILHEWHVATRSVPEANIPLNGSIETFRSLFEKALSNKNISFKDFVKNLDPEKTYCYELTSPYNRIIVNYPKTEITLLSVRNKFTGKEYLPETELGSKKYIDVIQQYDFTSIDKIINYVNSLNPMEHEGIVLCDSKFNRIKVKNASYVAYNKARDSLANSPRACLEIILHEKADDVIPFMPEEIVKDIKRIQINLYKFLLNWNEKYNQIVKIAKNRRLNDPDVVTWNDQKLFAKCVQENNIWESPCYAIYSGRSSSITDYIKNSQKLGSWSNSFLDNLLKLIK